MKEIEEMINNLDELLTKIENKKENSDATICVTNKRIKINGNRIKIMAMMTEIIKSLITQKIISYEDLNKIIEVSKISKEEEKKTVQENIKKMFDFGIDLEDLL